MFYNRIYRGLNPDCWTKKNYPIICRIASLLDDAQASINATRDGFAAWQREDPEYTEEELEEALDEYQNACRRAVLTARRLRPIARNAGVYDEMGEIMFKFAW